MKIKMVILMYTYHATIINIYFAFWTVEGTYIWDILKI